MTVQVTVILMASAMIAVIYLIMALRRQLRYIENLESKVDIYNDDVNNKINVHTYELALFNFMLENPRPYSVGDRDKFRGSSVEGIVTRVEPILLAVSMLTHRPYRSTDFGWRVTYFEDTHMMSETFPGKVLI